MHAKAIFGLVAAATLAVAQVTIETSSASSVAATTTESQLMPPIATAAFNPAPVNESLRFSWCQGQLNTCPQICGGAASQNFCQESSLTYTCVCPNGTAPDCTAYANTLPFYICQQTFIQCIQNNPNNAEAQQNCTQNEQCGTRNATAEAIAQTSASSMTTASSTSSGASQSGSATSSGMASGSGTASGSGASASSTHNAASVHELSTGAFAVLLAAAFKFFV